MNEKAMAAIGQDEDKKLRNAGLVYLYHEEGIKPAKLAKMCSLARTTIASYVRSCIDLLDWAKKQFNTFTRKIVKAVSNSREGFWVYIDKITMPNGEEWLKVGQTSRTPEARAAQMMRDGWTINEKKIKPFSVEVQWAAKCKTDWGMEIMENALRIAMIELNPERFKKNDRLIDWQESYVEAISRNLQVRIKGKKYYVDPAQAI